MAIISDGTVRSITLVSLIFNHNMYYESLIILVNYHCNTFIVQAIVAMIIIYDCNVLIVQVIGKII